MKHLWKDLLTALCMGFVLPGIMLNAGQMAMKSEAEVPELPTETALVHPVKVRTGSRVEEMELEAYLVRVVLAEMPASFAPEALKAQSIASRTYVCKAMGSEGKHNDGSICTDAACCQGYITEAQYLEQGGTRESVEKVASAVADTVGEVLVYDGELIEATYFSCSGGSTEDAVAVWGTEYPYLRSVSSPEPKAGHYDQTRSFTPEEFQALLGRNLKGSPKDWITITTYTKGGGVASMTIGGEVYSGTEIRSLLGLRSTVFTVEISGQSLNFTTRGYGHRVGMSQYGAEAMAVAGSGYPDILAHYYPGTELTCLGSGK